MFTNKVFIITGATRGMGLATTKRVLDLGGAVVMVYLSNINAANVANATNSAKELKRVDNPRKGMTAKYAMY